MKKINDIAVILFARLGSTRIQHKMVRPFAGTTLLDIAVEKLLRSKVVPKENMFLFVHEPELIKVGQQHGMTILERSAESANTESDLSKIHEYVNKIEHKYIVTFNACAPLLTIETIDKFIEYYIKSQHDGLFGVLAKRNFFWNESGQLLSSPPGEKNAPNTKVAPITYEAAHCLYASKKSWIDEGVWLGRYKGPNDPELFVMEEQETFDIDYPWQFELGEKIFSQKMQ